MTKTRINKQSALLQAINEASGLMYSVQDQDRCIGILRLVMVAIVTCCAYRPYSMFILAVADVDELIELIWLVLFCARLRRDLQSREFIG